MSPRHLAAQRLSGVAPHHPARPALRPWSWISRKLAKRTNEWGAYFHVTERPSVPNTHLRGAP